MKFKYDDTNKVSNSIKNTILLSTLLSCPINNILFDINSYAISTSNEDFNLEKHTEELIVLAENSKSNYNKEMAQASLNNLPDGELKTKLQNRINNIKTTSLTHSGNIDVYIKPQNILSLSLDTNVVTFEDYSGTESLEILGAIGLTVDSTLPYDLNSYLESEICSINGDKTLDRNVLNLKESSSNEYKHFRNIKEKVTLLADCDSGYKKSHSIDMKLNPSVFETDVYKTVVKFEIEQK
ncbi:MAG: hypothetical protein IJ086_00855 [Clostridium sp.]|nr:hypothetical protein [Clostridium sp.]